MASETLINNNFNSSELTLEYVAPFSTSPFRIQMIEAAGLALSAWHVRLRGSPALRLTMGPPMITGSSGGTTQDGKGKQCCEIWQDSKFRDFKMNSYYSMKFWATGFSSGKHLHNSQSLESHCQCLHILIWIISYHLHGKKKTAIGKELLAFDIILNGVGWASRSKARS